MKDLADLSNEQLYAMANIAPPDLVRSVVYNESRGNPDAVSPKGAKGKMQVMDATNTDPGYGVRPAANNSKEERVRVGTDYLGALYGKYGGDPYLTAAAYNAGPGRVDKLKAAGRLDQLPPETKKYAPNVVAGMAKTDDLSKLSDAELAQIAGVDLSKASDAELRQMAGLPEAQAPAAEPAAPQAPFMARVGRGVMDRAQGLKQNWLQLQAELGLIDPDIPRQYTQDVNNELAAYQQSAPSGIDFGRLTGGIAADAPLMLAGNVPGAIAGGFLGGAMNFRPSGSHDPTENALIGAGVAGAAAGLAPAARALFGNQANQTLQANVQLARQLGINPRPSQFTDNAVARRFEQVLDTLPGGAAAFKGNDQANARALNNAVLGVFGRTGEEITPNTVNRIVRQIDNNYNAALRGRILQPDQTLDTTLTAIRNDMARLPQALQSNEALQLLADPRFTHAMDADTYNAIRSELGRQSKNAFNSGQSNLGNVMDDLQSAMDDWAIRQLPPQQAARLDRARSLYRSYKVVDKALDSNTGNVSPAKLATAAQKNDPVGYTQGVNPRDISTIGRAASTIAKTPPDSGTAARQGLGWTAPPVVGSILGGPVGAAVGLAASLPGAYGVGRAYLSPYAQAAARNLEQGTSFLAPRLAPFLGGATTAP